MLHQFLPLFLLHSCFAQQQGNVALIVGGYWSLSPDYVFLNTAELYGCAGGSGASIPIANLTNPGYLMGGMYRADIGDVLVCGGYYCSPNCLISPVCQTWNPAGNMWSSTDVGSMHTARETHLMAYGPNLNTGSTAPVPIAIGYAQTSEIYDWATNTWSNYRNLTDRFWYTTSCLFQDNENQVYVYKVRSNITRLDVSTWSFTDMGPVPPDLIAPGRCVPVTIGGHRGIFIHYGFFYNFTTNDWVRRTPPPHYAYGALPNSMWSFNGRPTFFGNRKCDNHGACVDTEVVQYVPETDSWIALGDMSHTRTYHEVIEVPGSWCDYFVSPPTTTITTSMPTSPTTTGTATKEIRGSFLGIFIFSTIALLSRVPSLIS